MFVESVEGQSFVQVLKPSSVNDHIIIGSRQAVKTVSINDDAMSGLSTIRSMKGSSSATTAVAFHPTAESVFVSAGSNGEVSVWYYGAHNIAPLNDRWSAHPRAIHSMEFFPKPLLVSRQRSSALPGHRDSDSAMLLTAGADGELNCWDLCSYQQGVHKDHKWRKPIQLGNLRGPGLRSGLRDIDIFLTRQNDRYCVIAATEDGSIEYYESLSVNPATLELRCRLSVSTQTINSVRFHESAMGELRFASGGKDGYIRIFAIERGSGVPVNALYAIRSQGPIWAVRWRPGGKYIATCQSVMDSNIYVWDLDSRIMPAYVFSSHRDNVTDLFWVDRYHLLSCSRDNTVQLHAIKHAVIPIERMRTVNVSLTMRSNGVQTITSVCDVVNRTKFEKSHRAIDAELMKLGFPVSEHITTPHSGKQPTSPIIVSRDNKFNRNVVIKSVPSGVGFTMPPLYIGQLAPHLTRFVRAVSQQTTIEEVGKLCLGFSLDMSHTQCLQAHSETLRLLGWLLEHGSSVIELFITKSLEVFKETNDVVMVIAIGAVALFSPDHAVAGLVTSSQFVKLNRAILDVLRRLELWQLAAEHVFNSPLAEIRSISHSRTGINIACANCKREQDGISPNCSKCGCPLTECVLCGVQVKGLWVACEGCGHGGHSKHYDWWFSRYDVCPVPDCLHQCR